MSTCCPEFYPIKVSQLSQYSNIDLNDLLLIVESGSANYSRKSNIANLVNAFRLYPTGSYSGSFSGSFTGRVLSKNANLTGALSGSYQGTILSKNAIASGSFSGSLYGKLLSKNLNATGSFRGTSVGNHFGYASGSLEGSLISKNTKATGSFSGSFTGRVLSKNFKASGSLSGSYFGKIISKNLSATGSLSGSLFGTSTYSLTSSYLKQDINESNKFTYFDGKRLINSPYFSYKYIAGYEKYYISSSSPATYLILDSKAIASTGFVQSGLVLSNNCNRPKRVGATLDWGPEGWNFFSSESGSLYLRSYTSSFQVTNQNYTAKGLQSFFDSLILRNNVFYFWPNLNSYQTLNRDASVGIGVQAPNSSKDKQNTVGKLHIRVFSSSFANKGTGNWSGTGTVRPLEGALYVDYGSASYQRTFFVSGSGNMYSAGKFTILGGITGSLSGSSFGRIVSKNAAISGSLSGSMYGSLRSKKSFITGSFKGIDYIPNFKNTGKSVSFNGTASYAITSSFAMSVASSANSVNRKIIEVQAYGWPTSTNTIQAHGCPTTPYAFVANWVAKAGNSLVTAGTILNFNDVIYQSVDDKQEKYRPGAIMTLDSTNITIGWPNNWGFNGTAFPQVLIASQSPDQIKTFTAAQWNLRITLFY